MSERRTPAVPLLAAAFIAGTLAGLLLGGSWWLTAVAGALLAATWAVLDTPRTRERWLLILVVLAAAVAGHARFADADARPPSPLAAAEGVHEVVGVAREDASTRGSFARVDLDVESLDGEPIEGGLRLTLRAPREPVAAGERVRFVAVLEPPPEVESFDYAEFLRRRDIHVVAAFPDRIERLGAVDRGWRGLIEGLGDWAAANIERSLPEPESSLAGGVLTGERQGFSDALTRDLRVTGTTHLVVVSGQNVALLLGTAIALLTPLLSRRRSAIAALLLLAPYLVLVGGDPPVVRAAIMAVGIAFASVAGRRTPGWVYLAYAVAAMLAHDPLLARDVAFQLSATATAGVMLVAPALRDLVLSRVPWAEEGGRAALVEVAATATGATLAVLPVQAAAFEQVSLLAIPANIVVAPLYEATVAVALIAALLGWLEPVAAVVGAIGRLIPACFLLLVRALAEVPGAELGLRAPLAAGGAYYLALAAGASMLARRNAQSDAVPALEPSARALPGRAVALVVMAGGLWLGLLVPPAATAEIAVLDVGQGLAVLIEDGDSRVLIDTGPPDGAALRALPGAAAGRGLDAIILTHGDIDHTGALGLLAEREDIGGVLASKEVLDELGIEGRVLDIGDRVYLGGRTTIEVLGPPVASGGLVAASDNDASLVLLVTVGERRILLPADIEAAGEGWLVASGQPLRADAVVVPHHGSKTSSTAAFLDAVDPAVAVVSAGEGNSYGHPAPEVLERYGDAELFRTDEHGTVTLCTDGERLWVATER
ncbi:MAG: DNA internalization-related competence protein ComEC/Rec2 [Dehalococcoidia bacterium]|nr:DNA internalization-related competence protein ComEC/Rec2 [Dehalococcoidia bacterium]